MPVDSKWTDFIRRWQVGELRPRVWREAQLSPPQSEEFAHPHYWAAFTLTGRWR